MFGANWNPAIVNQTTAADEAPIDPLTVPLPVAAPGSWREREDRVRWVVENFTEGEKAKLYEQLNIAGYELSNTRRRWKAERDLTSPAKAP